jgi:excisionase family DNA binding protein
LIATLFTESVEVKQPSDINGVTPCGDRIDSENARVSAFASFSAYHDVQNRRLEQRYVSVNEAAVYLGLSPKTVYSWAEKHSMPAYKIGRVWRFDRAELDQFVRGENREYLIQSRPSGGAVGKGG